MFGNITDLKTDFNRSLGRGIPWVCIFCIVYSARIVFLDDLIFVRHSMFCKCIDVYYCNNVCSTSTYITNISSNVKKVVGGVTCFLD